MAAELLPLHLGGRRGLQGSLQRGESGITQHQQRQHAVGTHSRDPPQPGPRARERGFVKQPTLSSVLLRATLSLSSRRAERSASRFSASSCARACCMLPRRSCSSRRSSCSFCTVRRAAASPSCRCPSTCSRGHAAPSAL
jgi:hypothetical protein